MLLDVHAELLCEVVTVRFPSTDRGVQTLMLRWQANLLSHLFLWSISFFFGGRGRRRHFIWSLFYLNPIQTLLLPQAPASLTPLFPSTKAPNLSPLNLVYEHPRANEFHCNSEQVLPTQDSKGPLWREGHRRGPRRIVARLAQSTSGCLRYQPAQRLACRRLADS